MVPVVTLAPLFSIGGMAVKSLRQRETCSGSEWCFHLLAVGHRCPGCLKYHCHHVVMFVGSVMQSGSHTDRITKQE